MYRRRQSVREQPMGHYDNCRDGYCPKCGAAPGNLEDGVCPFCTPKTKATASVDAVVTNARIAAAQTYVFEQVEVKKTGRTASQKLRSGKVDTIYEITPVEQINGSWKKWVRDNQMFQVTQ